MTHKCSCWTVFSSQLYRNWSSWSGLETSHTCFTVQQTVGKQGRGPLHLDLGWRPQTEGSQHLRPSWLLWVPKFGFLAECSGWSSVRFWAWPLHSWIFFEQATSSSWTCWSLAKTPSWKLSIWEIKYQQMDEHIDKSTFPQPHLLLFFVQARVFHQHKQEIIELYSCGILLSYWPILQIGEEWIGWPARTESSRWRIFHRLGSPWWAPSSHWYRSSSWISYRDPVIIPNLGAQPLKVDSSVHSQKLTTNWRPVVDTNGCLLLFRLHFA